MTLAGLTAGYVALGLVFGSVAFRHSRSALDAVLVVLAWPLYAGTGASAAARRAAAEDEPARLARAVHDALAGVRGAAAGSPFSTLLGSAAAEHLTAEIDRAASRMRAVDAELATSALGQPARDGGAGSTASLRADAEASLRRLRASDAAAMIDLALLLGALRSRIVLARHAGSSAEGPAALVSEVLARIEGLGEAVACAAPAPAERESAGDSATAAPVAPAPAQEAAAS